MHAHVVHEDTYGSIIDHPDDDYLEIRWYDGSSALTGETFSARSALFADMVERYRRPTVLIDAVQFGMNAADMDVRWRDANVIPRLNAAGLQKIALIMPADFPMVGAPPAPEGPSDYPTAFFATRAEAEAWLAS